jgi:hypothetical protein
MKDKPKTPQEWAAYRMQLNCQIALDTMSGDKKPPEGASRMEYALYCLIHAIQEIPKLKQ